MRSWICILCVAIAAGSLSSCGSLRPPVLHVLAAYEGTYAKAPELRLLPSECSSPGSFSTRLERKEYQKKCAHTSRDDQTRTIKVLITDTNQPIVLGLMAYERTQWELEVAPNVTIQRVILGGYHTQIVLGLPEDAVVEVHTHDSSPCERCVHRQPEFYSYERVPAELESAAGLKASSFQSRYTGESFSIFRGM
jgi:hypothetical protein